MSLRQVQRERSYRAMVMRDYATKLTYAEFSTASSPIQRIEFGPGINVICGGNGAGKSTALVALRRALDHSIAASGLRNWVHRIAVGGSYSGVDWSVTRDLHNERKSGECPAPVVYIDASAETEDLIRRLRQDDEPGDLLEGVDPAPLAKSYIEMLSYVLRRSYQQVQVYEVTVFSEDDEPFPVFELTSLGRTYSVLDMGRGELAAAYLLWRLHDVPPGSIVLLEEPESHLASFSRGALADALVALVAQKDITIVASSHSPELIERLPSHSISYISSSPVLTLKSGISSREIVQSLGLTPNKVALVMTEDRVGAVVLREILAQSDRQLLNRLSIKYATDGESGLRRVLHSVAPLGSVDSFLVLGVLDGDQRAVRAVETDSSHGFGFLPGVGSPEEALRGSTEAWRAGRFADWSLPLPGGAEAFRMALERADGLDHHDWLVELSKIYGSVDVMVGVLTSLAMREAGFVSDVDELIEWLRRLVEGVSVARSW